MANATAGTATDATGATVSSSNVGGEQEDPLERLEHALRSLAAGDFSVRLPARRRGTIGRVEAAFNALAARNRALETELVRIGQTIGREGRMTDRARLAEADGGYRAAIDSVNGLVEDLVRPTKELARVIVAVAEGDLSQEMALEIEGRPVKGEFARIGTTVNAMVDQLSSFADEVTRVAREVGTEGKLGGQAQVPGVAGTWKDLTDNVNFMALNLTDQVRNIADVTTAVANGDLSQKITVDVKGEMLELKQTVNTMVDQLRAFAAEVTRVAREVGTEGKLGGQAEVEGVSGTWKRLTENVNLMASNLTTQVRSIAQVATAVAHGDLTQTITVDARGEILELKQTLNRMVSQLSSFAAEVTRVAREVGTEGKLGGQAEVEGVSGTWRRLTESVNQLAGNLTTQVRAIAEVSTAVAQGDLTRSIAVDARGEVAELKDNINRMIANLRDTTRLNAEQDWLKSNLASISGMLQGQRDLAAVTELIMREVTPTVNAQHGAFYLVEAGPDGTELVLAASYGRASRESERFKIGESLVGQAAADGRTIALSGLPAGYVSIRSGLGETNPADLLVMPVLFEDDVLGVIELASIAAFSEVHRDFLDRLTEPIGVVLSTIRANMRTEQLLAQSQNLTQELQKQSEELRKTNDELQEKARLLSEQNRDIEIKNHEIELAREGLEEKAAQLALSSKYKSEFLANVSHELRTPLNSMLILSRLLADNEDHVLTPREVEFARTINSAGNDLLSLINDILDLSKVEAGRMELELAPIALADLVEDAERAFRPIADENGLEFTIAVADELPAALVSDEQRLKQVLKNLLSNAFKFTHEGRVLLEISCADAEASFNDESLRDAERVISFRVSDTGVGIPSDKLGAIFEAFQQADGTTSRKYGGTGLGLSISKEIARLLRGEIHVASTVDSGSSFTLFLPLDDHPPLAVSESALERSAIELAADAAPGPRDLEGDELTHGSGATAVAEGGSATLQLESGGAPELVDSGRASVLVVEVDERRAEHLLTLLHGLGSSGVLAARPTAALALAREHRPRAIVLGAGSHPVELILRQCKNHPETRHVPALVIGNPADRIDAMRAGAAAHLAEPVDRASLEAALERLERLVVGPPERRVAVIESDDDPLDPEVIDLIASLAGAAPHRIAPGDAVRALSKQSFDLTVTAVGDRSRAAMLALLGDVASGSGLRELPMLAYLAGSLSRPERARLEAISKLAVINVVDTPARLLERATLLLHRPEAQLPAALRGMLTALRTGDAPLQGKKVLVIDDDIRNVFALTSTLEQRGMKVVFAENGREGLKRLHQHPNAELVLLDIMMPEMDGYETARAIRAIRRFEQLPIIALTAKAMEGDRDRSIAAGASDYITKPVDADQLLAMMRVWLDA